MKDQEIIALFFERSERAISELGNKYGQAIKAVARNILMDARDAEETVSDTYLTVWNRIPPTRPAYLGAYSCRIARNLSLKRCPRSERKWGDPAPGSTLHPGAGPSIGKRCICSCRP